MFSGIKNMPFRYKLLFSNIIILTFAIIIFGAVVFYNSRIAIRNQMNESTEQTLLLAKSNMLSFMADVENIIFSVQANKDIQNSLSLREDNKLWAEISYLENELLSIDVFRKKITNISLYAFNQSNYPETYASSIVFPSSVAEKEPWFKDTVDKKGHVCWNVFYNRYSDSKFTASRLILDTWHDNKPLGVVRADIDILPFLNNIDSIKLGRSGKFFMVKDNSIMTIARESFLDNMVNNDTFFNVIRNKNKKSSYAFIEGVEYLIVYDQLGDTGMSLVGMVPARELDGSLLIVRNAMVTTGLMSLIVGMVAAALVSFTITRSLYRFTDVMRNFEDNLDRRIEVTSNDDVAFLYRCFNRMMDKINLLLHDINEASQKQKNSELKALQAQINPHFLYNTLDSINYMAQEVGAKDISRMVTAMGSFFRHSLNNGREFISIANELEQVKSYIAISKIRFKDKFDVTMEIDEEILSYKMLKLSLQPLVENSIVHGFEDIDYKGEIIIRGYEKNGFIYFEVNDNGRGTDTDELNYKLESDIKDEKKSNSYGIRNVYQRLKLYFGNECGISFETNESGGVSAIVQIRKEI